MRNKSVLISVVLVIAILLAILCACTTDGKYTVKYVVDGQVYATATVNMGGKLVMPEEPKKSGYRFDGWYLDDGVWTQPFNERTAVIADISVYAHWLEIVNPEPQTYVITFDSKGGSEVKPIKVKEGVPFALPNEPELADYDFEGWYVDNAYTTEFTASTVVTRDMKVYAKWTLKKSDTYFMVTNGVLSGLTEDGKKSQTLELPLEVKGVEIVGIGDGLFENNTALVSLKFPSGSKYQKIGERAFAGCTSLTSVKFSDSVTEIGKEAFSGCVSLNKVQLPINLKRIEQGTFKGCSALTSVVAMRIDGIGAEAFSDCKALVSFSVPATVTEIGEKAFYRCYGMKSLALRSENDKGLRKIGASAFYNCTGLTSIVIPDTVTEIGESAFRSCGKVEKLTISNGITAIPDGAFASMSALKSVVFGSDSAVTSIGANAFGYCKALENLVLPQGVTELGKMFMYNCNSLTTFVVPEGVEVLPESAFENCTKLNAVTLPNTLKEIGARAFRSCSLLTSQGIVLPSSVAKIGHSAFRDCKALEAFTLPQSAVAVPQGAFSGCILLSSFDFGASQVASIGAAAFYGCNKLTAVNLPNSVAEVGESAYYSCIGIESVTFGSSLKTVGAKAFADCTKLTRVEFSVNTESVSGTAFRGDNALESIIVPTGNSHFESVDNVLFDGNGETLVFYPTAKVNENDKYVVPEGVKRIADGVFGGNATLKTVELPDTIEEIGASAFVDCVALESINYPTSLKKIGDYAFENCESLTTAEFNVGLVEIGRCAFKGARGLTSATMPATLVSVGSGVFEAVGKDFTVTVEIPSEELPLGWNRLWANSGKDYRYTVNKINAITGAEYDYVARQGKAVLLSYRGTANEVVVPSVIDGNTVIGLSGTFSGNTTVTSVTVPQTVEVIADKTFRGTTALTTLVTPFVGAYRGAIGVGGLVGYMFEYSETAVSGWKKQPAEGGTYQNYYVNVPASLESVTVTDSESIAFGAFANIYNIRNITLSDGLKRIGGWAFNDVSVRDLVIPSSVTEVGANAFTRSYLDYYNPGETAVEPTLTVRVSFASDDIPEGFLHEKCVIVTDGKPRYCQEGVKIVFTDDPSLS